MEAIGIFLWFISISKWYTHLFESQSGRVGDGEQETQVIHRLVHALRCGSQDPGTGVWSEVGMPALQGQANLLSQSFS